MNNVKILSKDTESKLVEVAIDEMVRDDLTGELSRLVDILGDYVVKIDNTYLDGYRYTWEVSERPNND